MMNDPNGGEQYLKLSQKVNEATGEAVENALDAIEPSMKKVEEGTVKGFQAIENGVVKGYKGIENGVVSGYKAIENGVVGAYTKVEDAFVDRFLKKDGETVEQAKERLKQNTQKKEQ